MKKTSKLYFIFLFIIIFSILVVTSLILFFNNDNSINDKILYAHFIVQDSNALKESSVKVNCKVTNEESCTITVPNFNVNDGYTLLGWNTNKDEINANILPGREISINNSMLYYSITKKSTPLMANFVIQNNTAEKSNSNTTCELYNGKESCIIEVPILTANNNNTIIGWNTDKDAVDKTLNGGEKININSDITYYSITKSNEKLTATFNVQTPSIVSASDKTVFCELYNGNSSCKIKTPSLTKLLNNVKVMGWSKDKDVTSPNTYGDESILLNQDTTFYSIVTQLITVTFDVGDDVQGQNIKAEKLSFNYTDKNGNTIIKEEGKKLSTTCISYNGQGCKISVLPTVYSKGNYIHGYSKTIGGKNMATLTTVYKEDTTLYTRVGYYNSIGIKTINVSYQKIYGNVIFEVENTVPDSYKNKVIELLDRVYKYYPELFYFNGKIFMLSKNTYNSVLKPTVPNVNETVGNTIVATNYNNVFFYYNSSDYLSTMLHEIGHAFDQSYGYIFPKIASQTDDIVTLFTKYKKQSNRPLRSYSYTNLYEFIADSFSNTMRMLLYEKDGKYPYTSQGSLSDDIKNTIINYINQKRDYSIRNLLIQ